MTDLLLLPYLENDRASILLLLDDQNKINPDLFQHWCLRLKQTGYYGPGLELALAVFELGLSADVPAKYLTTAYTNIMDVDRYGRSSNIDTMKVLRALSLQYPDKMQDVVDLTWPNYSVWGIGKDLLLVPDPKTLWKKHPEMHTYLTDSKPLAWARKNSNHSFFTADVFKEPADMTVIANTLGVEAFKRWFYGCWFAGLNENYYTDPGHGRKYNIGGRFRDLALPSILGQCQVDASELIQDTLKRYKGKDLTTDLLSGLDYILAEYDQHDVVKYCTTFFESVIPYAVQDSLHLTSNAMSLDVNVGKLLASGKMTVDLAWQWIEPRLKAGAVERYALEPSKYATEWPVELMRRAIVFMKQKQLADSKLPVGETLLGLCQKLHFSSKCIPHVLDNLDPQEWLELTSTLESENCTKQVLSLLLSNHLLLDKYRSEPRARIAVIVACLAIADNQKVMHDWIPVSNSFECATLPQPLYFFHKLFPQYDTAWHQLSSQMVSDAVGQVTRQSTKENFPLNIENVIDAIASIMMGKPVHASTLLAVRNAMGSEMSYEQLVRAHLDVNQVFTMPDQLDLGMFGTSFEAS